MLVHSPLPRGSTGFDGNLGPPPDRPALLTLVHGAARSDGREVVSLTAAETMATFDCLEFRHRFKSSLYLLVHNVVPILASVDRPPRPLEPPHVISSPLLESDTVEAVGWRLLSPVEAAEHPRDELLAELSEAELQEVRYWRPSSIGALVFNHWD